MCMHVGIGVWADYLPYHGDSMKSLMIDLVLGLGVVGLIAYMFVGVITP